MARTKQTARKSYSRAPRRIPLGEARPLTVGRSADAQAQTTPAAGPLKGGRRAMPAYFMGVRVNLSRVSRAALRYRCEQRAWNRHLMAFLLGLRAPKSRVSLASASSSSSTTTASADAGADADATVTVGSKRKPAARARSPRVATAKRQRSNASAPVAAVTVVDGAADDTTATRSALEVFRSDPLYDRNVLKLILEMVLPSMPHPWAHHFQPTPLSAATTAFLTANVSAGDKTVIPPVAPFTVNPPLRSSPKTVPKPTPEEEPRSMTFAAAYFGAMSVLTAPPTTCRPDWAKPSATALAAEAFASGSASASASASASGSASSAAPSKPAHPIVAFFEYATAAQAMKGIADLQAWHERYASYQRQNPDDNVAGVVIPKPSPTSQMLDDPLYDTPRAAELRALSATYRDSPFCSFSLDEYERVCHSMKIANAKADKAPALPMHRHFGYGPRADHRNTRYESELEFFDQCLALAFPDAAFRFFLNRSAVADHPAALHNYGTTSLGYLVKPTPTLVAAANASGEAIPPRDLSDGEQLATLLQQTVLPEGSRERRDWFDLLQLLVECQHSDASRIPNTANATRYRDFLEREPVLSYHAPTLTRAAPPRKSGRKVKRRIAKLTLVSLDTPTPAPVKAKGKKRTAAAGDDDDDCDDDESGDSGDSGDATLSNGNSGGGGTAGAMTDDTKAAAVTDAERQRRAMVSAHMSLGAEQNGVRDPPIALDAAAIAAKRSSALPGVLRASAALYRAQAPSPSATLFAMEEGQANAHEFPFLLPCNSD